MESRASTVRCGEPLGRPVRKQLYFQMTFCYCLVVSILLLSNSKVSDVERRKSACKYG